VIFAILKNVERVIQEQNFTWLLWIHKAVKHCLAGCLEVQRRVSCYFKERDAIRTNSACCQLAGPYFAPSSRLCLRLIRL